MKLSKKTKHDIAAARPAVRRASAGLSFDELLADPEPPRLGRRPRADEPATERIELRATASERASWERRAGSLPLSEWIRGQLNAAAKP